MLYSINLKAKQRPGRAGRIFLASGAGHRGRLVDVVRAHVQKSLTSSPDSKVAQVGEVEAHVLGASLIAVVRRREGEEIVGNCCVTSVFYLNIMYSTESNFCWLTDFFVLPPEPVPPRPNDNYTIDNER